MHSVPCYPPQLWCAVSYTLGRPVGSLRGPGALPEPLEPLPEPGYYNSNGAPGWTFLSLANWIAEENQFAAQPGADQPPLHLVLCSRSGRLQ